MATGNEIEKVGQQGMVQYGEFDLTMMEEAEKALPAGGGNFFKPKEGKNVVRFMPPIAGKPPVKIWYKHFFSAGGEKKNIVCVKYQYNEHCPICERAARLRSSGNKLDLKKARAFEPSAHVYANIVDMQNPEKGVQLWTIPQGLFKKVRKAIDIAEVGKVFTDPQSGYNIVFNRTGTGPNDTEYDPVAVARQPSPLPGAVELMPTQMDLEAVEGPPSDEDQDAALEGEWEDKTGGGKRREKDVTPRGGGKAKSGEAGGDFDY